MEIQEAYEYFEGNSARASDVARTLALAGIALVWIFKEEVEGSPRVAPELILPTALLCGALGSDLLQYVLGTVFWGTFHRLRENQARARLGKSELPGDTPVDDAPRWINWPTLTFFSLKLLLVAVAYFLLIVFIVERWRLV